MLQEIEKLMNVAGTSCSYRIVNLGGNSLYFEGIKSVICFDETEMQFQLKKEVLKIVGENLTMKYLDQNSGVVEGKIKLVEVL
jgi:sporulation protein YqfC